jgi:hypothetical protein
VCVAGDAHKNQQQLQGKPSALQRPGLQGKGNCKARVLQMLRVCLTLSIIKYGQELLILV